MMNGALTLNELRELDGERVWAEGGDWNCWAMVRVLPSTVALMSQETAVDYQHLKEAGARCYREKPAEPSGTGGIDKVSRHRELCLRLNELYAKKNHDYGDSFGQTFRQWGLAAAGVRMADKLNRFVALSKQAAEVDDESIIDTLMDLANYAVMTVLEMEGKG